MQAVPSLIREGLLHYRISFDDRQVEQLSSFLEELSKWNKRMNLTGTKRIEEIVQKLIYDAFFLHTRLRSASSVLDLGSGSGVVAIPLSILDPRKEVYSVDKSLKKMQFQRHVRRLLGLGNLETLHGRIEEIDPLEVDAMVAKAFGPTSEVLAKGGRHIREGGHAYIVTGKTAQPAEVPAFLLEEARPYSLPKTEKEYQLLVYKKVS